MRMRSFPHFNHYSVPQTARNVKKKRVPKTRRPVIRYDPLPRTRDSEGSLVGVGTKQPSLERVRPRLGQNETSWMAAKDSGHPL